MEGLTVTLLIHPYHLCIIHDDQEAKPGPVVGGTPQQPGRSEDTRPFEVGQLRSGQVPWVRFYLRRTCRNVRRHITQSSILCKSGRGASVAALLDGRNGVALQPQAMLWHSVHEWLHVTGRHLASSARGWVVGL